MGADIHLHVELLREGVWHHYCAPSIKRSYWLFGLMAGVRGDEKPIVTPKGFVEQPSVVTLADYSRSCDWHTASWFDAAEIDLLRAVLGKKDLEYDVLGCYLFGDGFSLTKAKELGFEDIRFVFWFDS